MSKTIHINATLSWSVSKGSAALIATCEPLALSVEADSEQELNEIIGETLHYFFRTHLVDQTLERFLALKGWSATGVPAHMIPEDVRFEVPWSLAGHAA